MNKPQNNKNKLYELNTNNSFVQKIAFNVIKPIIELAFDKYIEKHKLKEYLKEITKEEYNNKEENIITFNELVKGNGNQVFCGQEVLMKIYKISNNQVMPLPNEIPDVTFKIGQENNWKKIGLRIIGMKEGVEGIITVKITDSNNDKLELNSYYIKIIKIREKYPKSVNNMIILNDYSINKSNNKEQVKCGDKILIEYSLMNHNGEYIIKNQIAKFKVGDRKVPLAIELGVIGMKIGNSRTIISPPELLKSTKNMLIKNTDFDKENISIINLRCLTTKIFKESTYN